MAGTAAARQELGVGAGGDRTVEIDRRAEATAVDALERIVVEGIEINLPAATAIPLGFIASEADQCFSLSCPFEIAMSKVWANGFVILAAVASR